MKGRLAPKIRFNGFAEAWSRHPLSEAGKWRGGSTPSKADPTFWNGDIPWVSSGDVKELVLVQTLYRITKAAVDQTSVPLLPKDALILVTRSGILRKYLPVAILSREMAINQDIKAVITNGKADAWFLLNVLINQEADIRRTCGKEGTTVESVDYPSMLKYEIALPTLPEQQKIAAFLGAVDRKIQQLKRKQALLERYKTGVVQQLFSQELRFKRKDGGEFPEWEERQLSDFLIPTLREVPVPTTPYLSIGIRSHGKGTFQKPNTKPSSTVMETLFQVRPQDFIVNITFAWEGAAAIVPVEDDGGFVSHRFPTYTFHRSIAIPDFFRYVIVQPRFKHMLEMISPGGAGRNRVMSKTKLLEECVMLPHVEEQSRIAGFLMALDAKVAGVAQAVAAAQRWKKGLLQQMFV